MFSRHATRVHLELYRNANDSRAARSIDLEPVRHRTGDIWHVWVRGIQAGQLYGYRIEGPINQNWAIALIRTGCFYIRMQEQSPA